MQQKLNGLLKIVKVAQKTKASIETGVETNVESHVETNVDDLTRPGQRPGEFTKALSSVPQTEDLNGVLTVW